MATLTWIAGSSGQWTTAANWSPAQVPAVGDTVLINQLGAYQVTLGTSAEVANLTMADALGLLNVSGTLQVDNGPTIIAGTLLVSSGLLTATGLSNAGTLLDDASVTLNGTISAASLQNIGGTGLLSVNGTILNTGGTLDMSSASKLNVLNSGTIVGGVVVDAGTAVDLTLDGVTWRGELGLLPGATLTVIDGLTLTGTNGSGAGTLALTVASTGTNAVIFGNSQTFDNAKLVDAAGAGSIIAESTLAIGSGATFDLQAAQATSPEFLTFAGDTFVSQGTVLANSGDGVTNFSANGTLTFSAADFMNAGVIGAVDESAIPVQPTFVTVMHPFAGNADILINGSTFVNQAAGVIEVGQSAGVGSLAVAATTAFTNNGTILTQAPTATAGGTVDIATFVAGSGTIEISGGGVVTLETGAASAQSIDFTGGGMLSLDMPGPMAATINSFGPTDAILINSGATAVSYGSGDLKMQVIGSSSTFDLAITGTHALADFIIGHPSNVSTEIQLACFAAGTRIRTPDGWRAVETLAAGDLVTVADQDQPLPVVWVGHREVNCAAHPRPAAVWPVRIAAGTFAPNMPERALFLSPDHAVFVDGVLIPVRYLINDTTIQRAPRDHVSYHHVELSRHAVLLAEGLTVESLLPTADRSAFTNSDSAITLHPDFNSVAWDALGCAPLVVTGPELDAVRARLARDTDDGAVRQLA